MPSEKREEKKVENYFRRIIPPAFVVAAMFVLLACSTPDVRNETVASANGDGIKVFELREFLGIRGGMTAASQVPAEKKKEALDRLVSGRLLAQEALARGLDNTGEYRDAIARNGQGVLIAALFRKEMASKLKIKDKEVEAEAKKLREADKNLSETDASFRARQALSEADMRRIEGELISAAKKATASSIDRELIEKIGKGGKFEDNVALATVGAEKISYGEVKRQIQAVSPGSHDGQVLSRIPMAIEKTLEREITGRALAAYAKKQGIEGSEWERSVRKELERSVLINLLADKVVPKDVPVTDKEIGDAYAEHAQMFVRDGKKIPLSEVKERIRGFLQNRRRSQALEAYIEGLRKKAKITVNEALLPKV